MQKINKFLRTKLQRCDNVRRNLSDFLNAERCKSVLKAVAAIESAAPAHGAPKASSAEKTYHPRTKRPDIRCEVFDPKDGLKIRYTECNLTMAYGRWSRHADEKHNANNSQDQVDDGNVEAENRPAPKKRAEPKKATKKVAMKEPKKKAKPGGKQRTTGS